MYADKHGTVLSGKTDFFKNELKKSDSTLKCLQEKPVDEDLFCRMMESCLLAIVTVLERQCTHYFNLDITNKLRRETESARAHNIDVEEVIGVFSTAQKRAPNATLCLLSSKLWAQKNNVMDYLDGSDEIKHEKVVECLCLFNEDKRQRNRKNMLR